MRNSLFLLPLLACLSVVPSESQQASAPSGAGTIVRLDPALDKLIPPDAKIEKLADGFTFTEGPLWRPFGALWFSDVPGNVVREWKNGTVTEILRPGGFDGTGARPGAFIGPNGMAEDLDGTVILCQHGNRRLVRLDKDRKVTVFVDKFDGKKLNSPNDVIVSKNGTVYFTDPPYGLNGGDRDPAKELDFNGVFMVKNGKVSVVTKELPSPNGIAFSPDEKILYVSNSENNKRYWMRYNVAQDGTVSGGTKFMDVSAEKESGLPDGMKVDSLGNIWATGPGGIWVMTPEGKHIGTIKPAEGPANCAWGDADGKSLYITANKGLYRLKVAVKGDKLAH